MPSDVTLVSDGFVLSGPVVPGRHQVAFSYSLPFGSDRLDLVQRVDYPTLSFNLYVPDVGIQIDSPQLRPLGRTDLGGQAFLVFGAQNVPGQSALNVRLVGLPSTGGLQSLTWSLVGLALVLLGGGLLLAYRQRQTRAAPAVAAANDPSDVDVQRLELLVALARLDERYEQGELSEEEYERARSRGKRRLLALGPSSSGAEAGVA
jgi:LPXTG-motif cell wall-anchored protein